MTLKSPDFSDLTKKVNIAGLRPFRETTYRLDTEIIGNKTIVHNYGHGGAGITMSWGCAMEVEQIVSNLEIDFSKKGIAIIGAGVMGLSVATVLKNKSFNVSIYSKNQIPNTTSNIAGGQWAPSIIKYKKDTKSLNKFHRILRNSFIYFCSKIGSDYGVSKRLNFTSKRAKSFEIVPKDLIPEPIYYNNLPFENINQDGYSYETLLIEPPIYLSKLQSDLIDNNVVIKIQEFKTIEDFKKLEEKLIINCSGLGSRDLFNDKKLHPYKGNLVLLPPQKGLDYLYSSSGYMFPRNDAIVIGGSVEVDFDATPSEIKCQEILNKMINLFSISEEKAKDLLIELPKWYYKDFY